MISANSHSRGNKNVSQRNVHSAVDKEHCEEMEEKYGWQLIDVVPTKDPILKVDCIFDGEQTSFEDRRYDE